MSEVIQVKLKDIAEVVMGQSPPGDFCNTSKSGIPLLNGPTEFGLYHPVPVQYTTNPKKHSKVGDLLFCVRGSTTGRMNWSDQTYSIGRGLAAIRSKDGKEFSSFIKSCIEVALPKLLKAATGSTFPSVSRDQLESISLRLPSDIEIEFIEDILGTLEDKIDLNRKTNETLEGIAQALFQSWFIDFDPVRAKSEGGSTGLSDEISELFPNSFEDSDFGEIPRGWEIGSLGDLVDFQNGYAFKSTDWIEKGVPVVKIGSIRPGIIDLSNVSYVNSEIANQKASYRLLPGDILIGMTGYVGEVGMVPIGEVSPLMNQRVGKLHPKQVNFKPFVFCWTRSHAFRGKVERLSEGSAQANISSKNICSIELALPTHDIFSAFSSLVDDCLERYLLSYRESETLSLLRDSILPKLISGELKVHDAEKMLEEVGV